MTKEKLIIPAIEMFTGDTYKVKDGFIDETIKMIYMNDDASVGEKITDYSYDTDSKTITIPDYNGKNILVAYEREADAAVIVNEASEFTGRVVVNEDIAWDYETYKRNLNSFKNKVVLKFKSENGKDVDISEIVNEILKQDKNYIASVYLNGASTMFIEFVLNDNHGILCLPDFKFLPEDEDLSIYMRDDKQLYNVVIDE